MMSGLSGLHKRIRTFDVYDPQLQGQDLHPFFGELRSKCPVARTDIPGGDGPLFLVSRYEDCEFVFDHPEFLLQYGYGVASRSAASLNLSSGVRLLMVWLVVFVAVVWA